MSEPLSSLIKKKIIAEKVHYLRSLGAPVTAARGYDLRKIGSWSPQRLAALTRFEGQLNDFLDAMPITGSRRVFPRSERMKQAIADTFYLEAQKPRWLRGELIPDYGGEKVRLSLDNQGNLIVTVAEKRKFYITLDPLQLATNTEGYFRDVFDYMESRGGRVYVLKAGTHHFRPGMYNAGLFTTVTQGLSIIQALMNRYSNSGEWLKTIEAHTAPNDEMQDRIETAGFVMQTLREHEADRELERKKRKAFYRQQQRQKKKGKGGTRNII